MIDCICQYGKNLGDEHSKCPFCGTELDLLRKIKQMPDHFVRLGMEKLEQGEYEEAIQYLETSISLDGNAAAAYELAGDAYMQKSMYDDAVYYYDRALALQPENEDLLSKKSKAEEESTRSAGMQVAQDKKVTVLKRLLVLLSAAAFLLGLAIFPAVQWLFPPTNDNTAAVMAPADIKNVLANYEALKGLDISVTAEGNSIIVGGEVPDEATKELITAVVTNHAGERQTDTGELTVKETVVPTLTETAEKLQKAFNEDAILAGMGLKADASNDMIRISGLAPSEIHIAYIREMAKPLAMPYALDMTGVKTAEIIKEQYQTYVVKGNDTLYKIARTFYGDGDQWVRIYYANRDVIKKPGVIRAGMVLKIPLD